MAYAVDMQRLVAIVVLLLLSSDAFAAARLKYRTSSRTNHTVSARNRIRAARKASPTPVVIQGGPVKGGAVNLPHGQGRRAAFTYKKAAPPPSASALAPLKSIQQEFLERMAVKHSKGVKVKAVKAGRVDDFDPNRESDTEVVVIDGGTDVASPLLGGGHNRDQGGKPAGKKNNGKK